MNAHPTPPRLSLLGLPGELQSKIVEDAARQDAAYRSRVDRTLQENEGEAVRCCLKREGFGRSLEALSLTCKALRALAEEHLFATFVASRARSAIFELGLTSKYAHAFRTMTFASSSVPCLESTLVASTFLPNLRAIAISSDALVALQDFIPLTTFQPVGRNARSLDLYGTVPLEESVVLTLLQQFPLIESLTVENDACACLGDAFAALIAARPLLTSLCLHLQKASTEDEERVDYTLPPCWTTSPSAATFTRFEMSGYELCATKWSADPVPAPHLKHIMFELSDSTDNNDDLAAFFPRLLKPFEGTPITDLKLIGPHETFTNYALLPLLKKLFPQIQSLTLHPSRNTLLGSQDIEEAARLSVQLGYRIKTDDPETDLHAVSIVHRDGKYPWAEEEEDSEEYDAEHRAVVDAIRRDLDYARRRIDILEDESDVVGTRQLLGLFVALEADRLRSAD
ncbi:hypothetical protein RQP46_009844 [Phenoliferia psychrophenolica]